MSIRPLDRIGRVDIGGVRYVVATSGPALVAKPHAAPQEMTEEPLFAKALTVALETGCRAANRPRFEDAARTPPCALCNSQRTRRCRDCMGTGTIDRECDHCDEWHHCHCDECEGDGTVPCDCNRARVVRIDGHPFDLRLLELVLAHLPPGELTASAGNSYHALVMRSGDVLAIAMPMAPTDAEMPTLDLYGE